MYSLILHGRRSIIKLQKWQNLFQNGSAFANSFSSSSAADVSLQNGRKGQNFTVSYLVHSLGLTTKLAESISRKVSFEEKGNPDSVLNLFRSHGFKDSQISSIIMGYPRLLVSDAEKSLGPKLKFLQSRGASSSELTEILSKVPKILRMKEDDEIISLYYDIIRDIIETDKSPKHEKLCHSLPQGSKQENIFRNLSTLRELGVPQRFLLSSPIFHFSTFFGKEKFEKSLKKVVDLGFDPTSSRFVEALRIVYSLSEKKIEEKFNAYESLGLAVDDVWAMFKKYPSSLARSEKMILQKFETLKKCGLLEDEVLSVFKKFPRGISISEQNILNSAETILSLGFSREEFATMVKLHPQCIGYSAEEVKKKTEFLVKKMNWPIKVVGSNPVVFGLSMKKRIVPRCNVIKALISKELLRSELPTMSSVLACTDEVFLKRYVRKHDDDKELVGELMTIFTGKKK